MCPEEMTSQQGEVLRIIRELEFDHHSNLVFVIYYGLCRLGQDDHWSVAIQVLSILSGMTSGAVVRDGTTQRLEVFIKGSYEKIKDESMGKSMGNQCPNIIFFGSGEWNVHESACTTLQSRRFLFELSIFSLFACSLWRYLRQCHRTMTRLLSADPNSWFITTWMRSTTVIDNK